MYNTEKITKMLPYISEETVSKYWFMIDFV